MSPQIATNTAVSRDELLDFIRPRHHAIVITTRADGRPQASPVTCGEYREAMARQGKSLLRVTPVRWGPVATGGFPARFA